MPDPRVDVLELVTEYELGNCNESQYVNGLKALNVNEDELEQAQLIVSGELNRKDKGK